MSSMFADCSRCGARFESEIKVLKDLDNPICESCRILHGENLPQLLKLLKSKKIPGQEPIIHVLDLLFKRIQELEVGHPRK